MNDRCSRWCWVGIICLFVSGTIAAKVVFLVDNDLETNAESTIEHWQPDRQFLNRYFARLEKLTAKYLKLPAR
jgi:hypothetical protein